MRRHRPELTDEDLVRLVRLGGAVDQIAEAAGIDATEVRSRLSEAADRRVLGGRGPADVADALCC